MNRVRHPLFARVYARGVAQLDERGAADHRRRLLADLSGRIVEIGAGTGANFRHYPPTVSELIAIEPEPYLHERAVEAAANAAIPIRVIAATADRLPFDDDSFDGAVAALVLCSVDDPGAALAELHRVLQPEGELRFYEHVRSTNAAFARVQSGLDVVWPLVGGGCHTSRDTERTIVAAGFRVEVCDRFSFRPALLAAPASPHILGRARKPPAALPSDVP